MLSKIARIACPLLGLLMVAVVTQAGGVDPREMLSRELVDREQVMATPEQTSAAVSKARRAVVPVGEVPVVKEVPMRTIRPKVEPSPGKAVSSAKRDSWLLGSGEGKCAPLTSASSKARDVGPFKTPQEFARKMQQRGYQAFVLDIGDVRDQVVRVKVPDLQLDLTFVKAGMCR